MVARHRARSAVLTAIVVAASLALAACGGAASEGDGSPSATASRRTVSPAPSSPTATTTPTQTPTPTPTARATTQAPKDEGFAYVPWGPDDPPVPQRYASLSAAPTSAARCDDAESSKIAGPFWDLAVTVCRAIAGQGPWPSTTTVPSPPPAKNAYEACLDSQVAAMVKRALSWRAANPTAAAPRVRYAPTDSLSPCQLQIFETRVLTESDPFYPFAVPEGRLAVLVMAASADFDSTIAVDGAPVEIVDVEPSSGAATLVFLVPAPAKARTAEVAVSTTRGLLVSAVDLPAAPQPTATSTATAGTPSSASLGDGAADAETAAP